MDVGVDSTVMILVGIFCVLGPFFIYFRLKSAPVALELATTDSGIDKEALERAEREIADVDPRDTYLNRNLHLLENFYTTQGFTSGYMIGLVNKLIAADIAADFYFYANLPAGSVGGTGGGCYELYVDKDKVEEAKVLLKVHFNTKS